MRSTKLENNRHHYNGQRVRAALQTVLLGVLVTPFNTISGQAPLGVSPGDRVRIWYACVQTCQRAVGTVATLRANSLAISVPDQPALHISHADIKRLDRSRGRERKTVIGLGAGALAGALLGIIPAANYEPEPSGYYQWDVTGFVIWGLAAAGGAAVGAIVGSFIVGEDTWQPVYHLGMTFAPDGSGRIGFGGSIRY